MNIFLSYSSAHRAIAESLALSLRGDGHTVFYDRSAIEAGSEYDARIRQAIEECDLFVFLVSPESVAAGSYPLAEVRLAEQRWSHPAGHVLPIIVQQVPIKSIPPYLRAVSLLEPHGDFVAESSAAVSRISRRRPLLLRPSSMVAMAVLLLLAWFGYDRIAEQQARQREVTNLVDAARLDMEAGQYEGAFNALGTGASRFPDDPAIRQERRKAAMLWLRNIQVRVGERTFTDVVDIVYPVLSADAAEVSSSEAGDLLAHQGWCQYLLFRDDQDTDPIPYFQRAVDADIANPYAHAMWGFWILFRRGSVSEATSHFNEAMVSGRERDWVANWHIAGLLNYGEAGEAEVIRVANMMREEQIPVELSDRLWSIYERRLLYSQNADPFLSDLPAGSQAATFQWLYPESSVGEDRVVLHRFMLGRLQEFDGHADEALAAYRWVEMRLLERESSGSLLDRTQEGIRRLTR